MVDPTVQANGQKIKALRLARKWSQEDLAREAVCSKRTVENAEAGKRIRETGLKDIAGVLGVDVSELLGDGRFFPSLGGGESTDRLCGSGHANAKSELQMTSGAILDGRWHIVTNFEDVGEEEFDVEMSSSGQSVTAQATCVKGYEEGHIYLVEGQFVNLILRATWSCADPTRIEAGTVCLMLLENGNVLEGFNTYYHSLKRVLCVTPQTWRRAIVQKKGRTKRCT
jgi:transcriptional regulator with XRE-family HTH domain